jgi:hypothetical protein
MNGSASAQTNIGGTLQAAEPQVQSASSDVLLDMAIIFKRLYNQNCCTCAYKVGPSFWMLWMIT